jgi:hypothetical protein
LKKKGGKVKKKKIINPGGCIEESNREFIGVWN